MNNNLNIGVAVKVRLFQVLLWFQGPMVTIITEYMCNCTFLSLFKVAISIVLISFT